MKLPLLSNPLLSFGIALFAQMATANGQQLIISQNPAEICSAPYAITLEYSQNSINNLQSLGIVNVCGNFTPGGFKLFVASDHGGELRNQSGPSYKFIYQVNGTTAGTIGGGDGIDIAAQGNSGTMAPAFQPSTTPTLLFTSPPAANCDRGQNRGCDVGVQFQITTTDPMPEGRYTDTLRFSVTPN